MAATAFKKPKASLPKDFLWGFATASYQIEGGIKADGRGPSIWDKFTSKPGKIADGTDGRDACESYYRGAEDIKLLKETGAKSYRFSLSWTRIIPKGGRNDPVNEKGLQHYVDFVDDLLAAGIVPMVTLYHWDGPQELMDRYDGPMNKDEWVKDYTRYARVVFEAMGDRVKHWITFNEPFCTSILGYSIGVHAPGRTSNRAKNPEGDSSTEPWIVGHTLLCAHGSVVKLFREEFKEKMGKGAEIGITLNGDYMYPYDDQSEDDKAAAQRRLEFWIGWFADPIYFGDYPECMKKQLGDRLPKFTAEEIKMIKGSNDFYGMNHYCANYVRDLSKQQDAPLDDYLGNCELLFTNSRGESIGPETQSPWLRPNPVGFRLLLNWISIRYDKPKIYVTENGTSILGENDLPREEILKDDFRVKYYAQYVENMARAFKEDGVNVRSYSAWSLMDNFEWAEGYETRFGTVYVDYKDDCKRYPKKSAKELKGIFDKLIEKTRTA